jgi:hypothetical protein
MFIIIEINNLELLDMPYSDYASIQHLFSDDDYKLQRRIFYLRDEKYKYLEQYPNLDHYYIVTDLLIDKTYGLYTDGLEKLIKYGTILD